MNTTDQAPIDGLSVLVEESFEDYIKGRETHLSSHALGDFRDSPLLFHQKKTGVIPDKDTKAYVLGRASHTLILEGLEVLEERYAFGGPINPSTKKPYGFDTKAFRKWETDMGRPAITNDYYMLIGEMWHGVQRHEMAMQLLSEGKAEGVVRREYCGTPCQIRLDWLNPTLGIVDLKTCENLKWFRNDVKKYRYIHQMAFYRGVFQEATKERNPVYIIAVEKTAPYRVGVFKIGEDALSIAEDDNRKAIKYLLECQGKNEWPTGFEELQTIDRL